MFSNSEEVLKYISDEKPEPVPCAIKVEGDTATALTYWIQFNNNAHRNQAEWMLFGSWYDEFVKVGGEWFFSLHRIHNEGIPGTFTAGQENPVKQLDTQ